ncbi:MAG TPA: hypothetical protein VMF11_13875 [Candidatus Baltobacteraceae bacterium]|nr:hypothetical protein [Candidatus Baltobacteraceae bacterium]
MDTQHEPPTVVTATGLETRAVRRRAAGARVVEAGVGLANVGRASFRGLAVSCGLAGGVRDDLATGTILIPSVVATTAGRSIACDAMWTARLRAAAARLGYAYVDAPLLTSETLITGSARAPWASRGFAAVDMETAAIPASAIAAVRVILDTPKRELSPDWLYPARAMLRPKNWGQALWLARVAPRCADVAAHIVAAALAQGA